MDSIRARARRVRSALGRQGARLPIRWRLTLMTFGLLAVLLGGLGAMVSISEEHTLLANQAIALRREARLAGVLLRPAGLALARPNLQPTKLTGTMPAQGLDPLIFLVQRFTGPNSGAAVYGADGTVLYAGPDLRSSDASYIPATLTLSSSFVRQAAQTVPADDSYSVATDSAGARQLVVLIPILDGTSHATVAVLQISAPTAPIDSAVNTTRLVLALGIFGALCIAAALMFPLMSAGLRPLVTMERASERIAGGALSLRMEEPPTNDEIGQLARSFNSMVAQLEAAFARQKQFVADVSHELRTPLTALGGGLEMLMLGANRGDAEAARRLTRGMYREVERMRRLVEDLLTLTRLDEGRAHLRTDAVAVAPLIAEVAEQTERLAAGRHVQTVVAPKLPPLRADADHLRQVLLILVDNAIKYTPEDGSITLTARLTDAGRIELAVRDTGAGIAAEDLPHVFERFYRADRARAHSQGSGAGLGLSIAQGLVEAQGGEITIASVQGEGTTVTLRFPVALALPAGGGTPALLPAPSTAAPAAAPAATGDAEVAREAGG